MHVQISIAICEFGICRISSIDSRVDDLFLLSGKKVIIRRGRLFETVVSFHEFLNHFHRGQFTNAVNINSINTAYIADNNFCDVLYVDMII